MHRIIRSELWGISHYESGFSCSHVMLWYSYLELCVVLIVLCGSLLFRSCKRLLFHLGVFFRWFRVWVVCGLCWLRLAYFWRSVVLIVHLVLLLLDQFNPFSNLVKYFLGTFIDHLLNNFVYLTESIHSKIHQPVRIMFTFEYSGVKASPFVTQGHFQSRLFY